MNNTATVDLSDMSIRSLASPSGTLIPTPEIWAERSFSFPRMVKMAGFAFLLAGSSVTAIVDPWLLDRRRRDAVVTVSIYQEFIGRPISRSEALRIAQQILEQAERERLEIAEFEATRGIQWEE